MQINIRNHYIINLYFSIPNLQPIMSNQDKIITWQEYSKHIEPQNCWILIDGYLYDVSDYLVQHPGGDDILLKYSGIDATQPFNDQQHSAYAVSLRDARKVGKIESPVYSQEYRLMLQQKKKQLRQAQKSKNKKLKTLRENIPWAQVQKNNTSQSCWIAIQNKVYDVTSYMSSHPGGEGLILEKAGKDATVAFKQANHSQGAIQKRNSFLIGTLQQGPKSSASNLVLLVLLMIGLIVAGWFILGAEQ